MMIEKRRFLSLFAAFFWLASTLLIQPAQVYAQDWGDFSADVDGDGLTNQLEESGWENAAGSFTTDPLDADSDDDGLTDGQEKLYDTDPNDDTRPGIYVEYEGPLKTIEYFARDSHSPPQWGWQQYGSKFISLDAVVVRRGATFSVGGPADATIQVIRSLGSLTPLVPERDPCAGRWTITVPVGGTVGKYTLRLERGGWNKSLNLYVIFELPEPGPGLTQAMIDTFLYDDDPDNMRDEIGVNLGVKEFNHDTESDPNTGYYPYGWIPYPTADYYVAAGIGYRFKLQQFEPFVFEDHVMEAINGQNDQEMAAKALLDRVDAITRIYWPAWFDNSWRVLQQQGEEPNQCSNLAGLATAFHRAAGIPAHPFFVDWRHGTFDHSVEMWLEGEWWAGRGYAGEEPQPDCGIQCGSRGPMARYGYGYKPYYSGTGEVLGGSGNMVLAADENWVWGELTISEHPDHHEYRWPSWDIHTIVRKNWFDTLAVPYWSRPEWGWTEEPVITGTPPGVWPAPPPPPITSFTTSSPDTLGETTVFSNTSAGPFLTFEWDFGDGSPIDTAVHPTHTYATTDTFTVVLTATNSVGSDTATNPVVIEDPPSGLGGLGISAAAISSAVQFGQVVADYGLDLDGDGRFDQLVIEVEVIAGQPGEYWIRGVIGSDHFEQLALVGTGGDIAGAMVHTYLTEGLQTVQLPFNGTDISLMRVDGPYTLDLWITDVENPGPAEFFEQGLDHRRRAYTTAAYRADDFETFGATLSDSYRHQSVDSDGDGYSETLVVETSIDIQDVGTYAVMGDLYDGLGEWVAQATWRGSGPAVVLRFDGVGGTVGPYTLRDLYLFNAEGKIIDSRGEAYTMERMPDLTRGGGITMDLYLPESGGIAPLGLTITPTHVFDDRGVDLDGDGLYDQLVIDVQVEVSEADPYRVEGWLEGPDGSLMVYAISGPTSLSTGLQTLSLAFEGRAINGRGVDGPFTLMALKILSGATYEVLDEMDVAYTTSAYDHDDFEEAAIASMATLVFEDDMESGTGKWDWESPWALRTDTYRSPSHAWTDSPDVDYANNRNVSLATKSIGVPESAEFTKAVVMFQGCYALEANDYGYVEISVNGGAWTTVRPYTDGTKLWYSEGAELRSTDDITSLKVRFRLSSDASGTADGWYIDDVTIAAQKAGSDIYLPVIMK